MEITNQIIEERRVTFAEIVFIQGWEAAEPLQILDEQGKDAAVDYLMQWENGEEQHQTDVIRNRIGSRSQVYIRDNYVMVYSSSYEYISLLKIINVCP